MACSLGPTPRSEIPRPRGIVLVVLDTLRADALSTYGNSRPTSPAIDRLASEGVVFESAISHAAWTLPGFVGLMSGSQPSGRVYRGRLERSLATDLKKAGYRTAAFTEGAWVSRRFGFQRGFDVFWEKKGEVFLGAAPGVAGSGGIDATFDRAERWLRGNAGAPFFLLVHSYEVHLPYTRRTFARDLPSGRIDGTYEVAQALEVTEGRTPVGPTEVEYVRALYEGGVAEADRHVGRLLRTLSELGIADRTLVVVTSDHGEELGERGPQRLGMHGRSVYDEVIRVPLVIRYPRMADAVERVEAQVRLIDVAPTVLQLAGVRPEEQMEGRSLVPLMRGADDPERVAYVELTRDRSPVLSHLAVRRSDYKLIVDTAGPHGSAVELYDLRSDPGERHDLADLRPRIRNELYALAVERRTRVDRLGRFNPWVRKPLPARLRQRLRALGYAP